MPEVYSHSGYTEGYPSGIELHFWHLTRSALVYRWLKPHLKPDDTLMDVGCGTGHVVRELASRRLNIYGVELGRAPVVPGVQDLVRTKTDLFDLDAEEKSRITVVLLLDVLEHMADRRRFLRRIFEELPHCRQILITVPARRELWSGYDEYWGHHLRYDRPGLERELAGSGFVPVRSRYFFHWLYLVSMMMGLTGLRRRTDFQPIKPGGLKALLHRLLYRMSLIETRLLPASLGGSSIICLATRDNHSRFQSRVS